MGRWLALLLIAGLSGCTCGHDGTGSGNGANGGPTGSGNATDLAHTADGGATDARFSAPIDAVHSVDGAVYIAGLVVPSHAIEVTKLLADGKSAWTRAAVDNVAWSADAELDVRALGTGLIVTWDGPRGDMHVKAGRIAQLVDTDGNRHGDAFPVGGPICTTRTELAWPETGASGTRVMARNWEGVVREVARVPSDHEPSIVCSRTSIFVTSEGDTDVSLVSSGAGTGNAANAALLLGPLDFPNDDEREHQMYGFGERLDLMRIGTSGNVALREMRSTLQPWHATGFRMREEDDLVAVDGDAHATYVVTTHDEDPATCDATFVSSVHVEILGGGTGTGAAAAGSGARAAAGNADAAAGGAASSDASAGASAGATERDVVLATADCAHERGPFWTDALGDDMVVAWAVRAARADKTVPPIAALDFRTIGIDGVRKSGTLAAPADALVDAGCDGTRCYAVALSRAVGTDVMLPEAAHVLLYP